MKKKNRSLLFAGTCLFSLASFITSNPNSIYAIADTAKNNNIHQNVYTVNSLEESTKTLPNPLAHKNIEKTFGYNLSTTNYVSKDGKVKIDYPYIKNYKGELLQSYMNQDIQNLVNKYTNGSYSALNLKYNITRMDSQYLSITFSGKGVLDTLNKELNIFDSITFDIGKSCNIITTDIFVKDNAVLKSKLEKTSGKSLEYEGLKVFFDGSYATFYFMPLDDSSSEFTKISIPLSELDGIVNFDFGTKTAS